MVSQQPSEFLCFAGAAKYAHVSTGEKMPSLIRDMPVLLSAEHLTLLREVCFQEFANVFVVGRSDLELVEVSGRNLDPALLQTTTEPGQSESRIE